jgi:hypothetical protein
VNVKRLYGLKSERSISEVIAIGSQSVSNLDVPRPGLTASIIKPVPKPFSM